MRTEVQVRDAIAAKIAALDPQARVHKRFRYPLNNQLAAWLAIHRDDDGKLNSWQIRRVRRLPTMRGIPGRLVKVELVYEIKFLYGLTDKEDDPSEETAQRRIDDLAALFEADFNLGLGAGVTHGGLELPADFEDVETGSYGAHRAVMRLSVEVANVNCE